MWSSTLFFLNFSYLKLVILYSFFLSFFFFFNFKTQYPTLLTIQITPKTYTISHHLNNSHFYFHPNMTFPLKTSFHLFTSLFKYEILFKSTSSIFFSSKVNTLSIQIPKLFFLKVLIIFTTIIQFTKFFSSSSFFFFRIKLNTILTFSGSIKT